MFTTRYTKWTCHTLVLAAIFMITPAHSQQPQTDQFTNLFAAELDNRSNARAALAAIEKRDPGTPQQQFWQRYMELEQVNLDIYAPHAQSRNLALSNDSWVVGMKAVLAHLYHWMCRSCFVSTLASATDKYLDKLKNAAAMTDATSTGLYTYVVAQEAAQVNALRMAAGGNYTGAAMVLHDFAECARRLRENAGVAGTCDKAGTGAGAPPESWPRRRQ